MSDGTKNQTEEVLKELEKRVSEQQPEVPKVAATTVVEDKDNNFPTERIELPSQGHFYSEESPLSSGFVDLHYMTAKHEDILTSRNLIQKGVAIDRLVQSLVATPGVDYNDFLLGDKNAITIAARILGYGKDYKVNMDCPSCGRSVDVTVNLQDLGQVDSPLIEESPKGINEFEYILPISKTPITFKLLTTRDDNQINLELDRLKKISKGGVTAEVTTRLKHAITSVNGSRDQSEIRKFVDRMISRDAMEFRKHVRSVNPDIDMSFEFSCYECGYSGAEEVPLGIGFFWPDAAV